MFFHKKEVVYQPLSVEVKKQKDEKISKDVRHGNKIDDNDAGSVEANPIEEVIQEADKNDQWTNVTGKVMRYGRAVRKPSKYRDDLAAININYFHPLARDEDDDEADNNFNETALVRAGISDGIGNTSELNVMNFKRAMRTD